MKKLSELFDWFLDFWPLFGIVLFYIFHRILIRIISTPALEINFIISSFTQLAGGIITLIIVSKNFSQFRQMNLFSWLKMKFNSFPLRKHHYTLDVGSSHHAFLSGELQTYVKRKWDTLEDGIKELERRIDELRNEVIKRDDDIKSDINSLRQDLNNSIKENSQKINDIRNLIEFSVLDDIHFQVFGALLILYGFVVDIFPNLFR